MAVQDQNPVYTESVMEYIPLYSTSRSKYTVGILLTNNILDHTFSSMALA